MDIPSVVSAQFQAGARSHAGVPCKGRVAPLESRSPPDPAFSIRKLRPVKARVHVTLKPGILDPQGKAILHVTLVRGAPGAGSGAAQLGG